MGVELLRYMIGPVIARRHAMSVRRLTYTTDLTDEEWRILAPLLPSEKAGG